MVRVAAQKVHRGQIKRPVTRGAFLGLENTCAEKRGGKKRAVSKQKETSCFGLPRLELFNFLTSPVRFFTIALN